MVEHAAWTPSQQLAFVWLCLSGYAPIFRDAIEASRLTEALLLFVVSLLILHRFSWPALGVETNATP